MKHQKRIDPVLYAEIHEDSDSWVEVTQRVQKATGDPTWTPKACQDRAQKIRREQRQAGYPESEVLKQFNPSGGSASGVKVTDAAIRQRLQAIRAKKQWNATGKEAYQARLDDPNSNLHKFARGVVGPEGTIPAAPTAEEVERIGEVLRDLLEDEPCTNQRPSVVVDWVSPSEELSEAGEGFVKELASVRFDRGGDPID